MASVNYPQSHFNQPTSGFALTWLFVQVIIISLLAQVVRGQNFTFIQKIDAFPIQDQNGTPYPFPLLGGLNAPRPQFVDIDGDNDLDLFLQENTNDLIFFENTGSATVHQFQWRTDRYDDLDIDDWYRFVDMDGDSDFDLLTARPGSWMRYFRNDGNVNTPTWILAADTLKDINRIPIPAEYASIPFLCDIDDNSYPDLFIGRQTGRVSYYRHQGMDANNLPRYEFVTDTFQGILIIGGAFENTLHGANSPEYIDIDADQDFDLFWGDFFWPSLYFLENVGTPTSPQIELADSTYPLTNPLINGGWNVPRFADINADGDFDLFVGEIGGSAYNPLGKVNNFYYYENTGSPQNAFFTQITNQFIPSFDIGIRSIPALVDIDADGDLDLFAAPEFDLIDQTNSSLQFCENIGTAQSPIFRLVDSDYLDLNFDYNYSPTFVDIDADEDQDLFIGKYSGHVYFFENTGTVNSPNFPSFVANYAGIDVGNYSTPAFVDIDADNDFDLFIGEYLGNINFYENTGDSSVANFILADENYFGIDVGEWSVPFFADVDGDGDSDLIIGSDDSGFKFYRNAGTPQIPNFIAEPFFNLHAPRDSSPLLMDINNDGDLDLLSGSLGGGLGFYENLDSTTSINNYSNGDLPGSLQLYQNYPNPFNPTTVIKYQLADGNDVELTIYNLLGQLVKKLVAERQPTGTHEAQWNGTDNDGRNVSSGIYIYRLEVGRFKLSRKMLLIR
jgi:hypothetical protein